MGEKRVHSGADKAYPCFLRFMVHSGGDIIVLAAAKQTSLDALLGWFGIDLTALLPCLLLFE
jgi:hypothetical protein